MSELKPCQMTADEAIKILESVTFISSERASAPGDTSDIEALRMAISALRAQPDNEPLTLEQLREMDGEPVWIKDGIGEGWFLTGAIAGMKLYFYEKSITIGEPLSGCGKTWLAYRRKPEPEGKIEK